MTKDNARPEFEKLAEAAGFVLKGQTPTLSAYYHEERVEGFKLIFNGNAFDSATWHAPTEYVTVVDTRKPGERGKRDGLSLVADAKKRAVGMDEVHIDMQTSAHGMEVLYTELKRRIKNPGWRES